MLQSKISCHTFTCLYQPRPMWKCIMETRYMPKELGLFFVALLNFQLFIQLEQFIIVRVTLPTLSHQVPSNLCWFLKRLNMNLLNVVTLFTLKVVLGYQHNRLKKYWLSSNLNFQGQPSQKQEYCCPNFLWTFKTKYLSTYSPAFFSCIYCQTKTNGNKITHRRYHRKYTWIVRALPYLSHDQVK